MRIAIAATNRHIREMVAKYSDWSMYMTTPYVNIPLGVMEAAGVPWCADNGFFSNPDEEYFREWLAGIIGSKGCSWVCCPDVVGNAKETLRLWLRWKSHIEGIGFTPAYVLQDGSDVDSIPEARVYFIGGTTGFKLGPAAAECAAEVKRRGAWLHMGRVNSIDRLIYAHSIGCDSVDGTSYAKWSMVNLECGLVWCKVLG